VPSPIWLHDVINFQFWFFFLTFFSIPTASPQLNSILALLSQCGDAVVFSVHVHGVWVDTDRVWDAFCSLRGSPTATAGTMLMEMKTRRKKRRTSDSRSVHCIVAVTVAHVACARHVCSSQWVLWAGCTLVITTAGMDASALPC
jgi:hypothetical protein